MISNVQETELSDRVRGLRDSLLSNKPALCVERARIVTEYYRNSEATPMLLRRAYALERVLSQMSIYIQPGELIVGNQASGPRAAPVFPEFSWRWLVEELDTLPSRKADKFVVSPTVAAELKELLPWWEGKSTEDKSIAAMPPESLQAHRESVYLLTSLSTGLGHINIDYEKVLRLGMSGIRSEAEQRLCGLDIADPDAIRKRQFYEAVIVVCNASIRFAGRFAGLARQLALEASDAQRKQELEQVAEVCERVPGQPARTLHEAIQSFWFTHLVVQIESSGHSMSPGRFDQYMWRYFQCETDRGREYLGHAKELLQCLWIKFNEVNKIRDKVASVAFGGYPMFQNVILGGVTPEGVDASNELSLLCLQTTAALRLPQPSLSVRYRKDCPAEFWHEACKLTRAGLGMPAFFNDETIVPLLESEGASLQEARDYAAIGCVEYTVQHKTEGYYSGGFMNLCKVLEITFHEGKNPATGHQLGLPIRGPFDSYETLLDAFKSQVCHFMRLQAAADNNIDAVHSLFAPTPFASSLMDDCLQRGVDIRHGGAKFNYISPMAVGLGNIADSFAALQRLVYEDRRVTFNDLKDVLDRDFRDNEEVRLMLMNDSPKYGNDIDAVDDIARHIGKFFCDEFAKYRNIRGGPYQPGLQSISAHALFSGSVGAGPDGRHKADLIADGGVSPAQGRDIKGPTALMRSVAKLDHMQAKGGELLNIKLHPSVVATDKGIRQLMALVEGFFSLGAQHVQFNVISSEMLRDAQRHPDRYAGLVIRVAGFSVFFTDIDRALQDDIIARTEQTGL